MPSPPSASRDPAFSRKKAFGLIATSTLLGSAGYAYFHKAESSAPMEHAPSASEADYQAFRDALQKRILAQESEKDATCFSTVRMIERMSIGRELSPAAEIARIEASRSLLWIVWAGASQSARAQGKKLDASLLVAALPEELAKRKRELEAELPKSGKDVLGPGAQGVHDQKRTTENFRTLLSISLSIGAPESSLLPLRAADFDEAASIGALLTRLLLDGAGVAAQERSSDRVDLIDIQKAYTELKERYFKNDPKAPAQARRELEKPTLHRLSLETAQGKLAALARYNGLPPARTGQELSPFLSRVVGFPVDASGAEAIFREVVQFGKTLSAKGGPQRSDTFVDSKSALAHSVGEARHLQLADVFNAVQDLFPTRRLPNADAEVLMIRNVFLKDDTRSQLDQRKVTLEAPALDATRDTGIHWLAVEELLKSDQELSLDPFAAELLSETLSEYAYFLLRGAIMGAAHLKESKVSSQILEQLPWKFPLGRFFPTEDPSHVQSTKAKGDADPSELSFIERPVPSSASRAAAEKAVSGRSGFQAFMGSGLAVVDYDGDDRPDLFLAADAGNRVLKNLGNFQFVDVSSELGLTGWGPSSRHPLLTDLNQDGTVDLILLHSHEPSRVYLQLEGKFVDKTKESGLLTGTGAHTGTLFDADSDGDLDLFVGYYGPSEGDVATPSIDGRNGYRNQLWKNDGRGHFSDASRELGLDSPSWTLASAAFDMNRDGRDDLWLANDFGRDEVFARKPEGGFLDLAPELRVDDRGAGMNVSVVDVNGDEEPDVFVSMIEMFSKTLRFVLPNAETEYKVDDRVLKSSYYISGMKLFASQLKQNTLSYEDQSHLWFDSSRKGWAWGAAFFDADLDGDSDLYLTNGWIENSAFFAEPNQLMENRDGRWVGIGPKVDDTPAEKEPAGPTYRGSSRATVASDLDGDGQEDLLVVDYRAGLRIFENTSAPKGEALVVELEGSKTNPFAVGAKATLRFIDAPSETRWAQLGDGYLATRSPHFHFSLPRGKELKELEVRFPLGQVTRVSASELLAKRQGQRLKLRASEGK